MGYFQGKATMMMCGPPLTTTAIAHQEADPSSEHAHRLLSGFVPLLSYALSDEPSGLSLPLQSSASELKRFMTNEEGRACCTVSSLDLHGRSNRNTITSRSRNTSNKSSLEESAARNLRCPVTVSRDELEQLPCRLLVNFSKSFMSLVDSRVRSSLCTLARQGKLKQEVSFVRILYGLFAACDLQPSTVIMTFEPLNVIHSTGNEEYIMPLVAQFVVDLNVFGQTVPVQMDVPGTIRASIHNYLSLVDVEVETNSLLRVMMGEARKMAKIAIAIASGLAASMAPPSSTGALSRCNLMCIQKEHLQLQRGKQQQQQVQQHQEGQEQQQQALPMFSSNLSMLPSDIISTNKLSDSVADKSFHGQNKTFESYSAAHQPRSQEQGHMPPPLARTTNVSSNTASTAAPSYNKGFSQPDSATGTTSNFDAALVLSQLYSVSAHDDHQQQQQQQPLAQEHNKYNEPAYTTMNSPYPRTPFDSVNTTTATAFPVHSQSDGEYYEALNTAYV